MLVLSRKAQQGIWIGDDVLVKVLSIDHGRVKLGIEAPANVHIDREELRSLAQNEQLLGHITTP